jgi:hypothetical protein
VRQGRPQDLPADSHARVTESVNGDGPETLFKQVPFVGLQILA